MKFPACYNIGQKASASKVCEIRRDHECWRAAKEGVCVSLESKETYSLLQQAHCLQTM